MVNPTWYGFLPTGVISIMQGGENPDQLAEWRADGMKIIPTIGDFGDAFLVTKPDLRTSIIGQIVKLADQMNYDGIDIDFENYPVTSRDAFSDFIEQLSAKLHADHRLLSVAVHPKTDDAGTWSGAAAQDWTRIAPAVDVFTIMTYDYTDRNQPPGPISPPNWVHDVLTYAATVTDLHKVRMGLPFYGYSWLGDNPPATTTTWQSANRLIQSFHLTIARAPSDMEAHIEVKARGLPKQAIYFADSAGIEYKLQHILKAFPELGGVAIWGIGGEDPSDWDVLRAARQPNCVLNL